MKLLSILALFLAASAFGQSKFLVEYTTTEKDYQSGHVYAVICGPSNPDCDIPVKTVVHYEPFETTEKALKWVNSWGTHADADCFWGSLKGECLDAEKSDQKTFVRLLSVTPVPVAEKVERKEIPQPAKVEERKTYKMAEDVCIYGSSTGDPIYAACPPEIRILPKDKHGNVMSEPPRAAH